MGLEDREYARKHRMDPAEEKPPKPRLWIVLVSLVLIALFILAAWPRH